MGNRIATLFDLDALLASASRTPKARTTHGSPASRRPADAEQARTSRTTSVAFDFGEPISCEHDRPAAVSTAQSLPPVMDMNTVYPFRVESFEADDGAETETVELPDPEGEPGDLYKKDSEATAEAEEHERSPRGEERLETHDHAGQEQEPDVAARSESLAVRDPVYAAQLAAVERDLRELATRTQHPTPDEERSAGLGADSPEADASPPSPRTVSGHQVFDDMASGMQYANTFALPAVEVKRTFAELNERLDTERQAERALAAGATTQARDAVLAAAQQRVSTFAISDEELARDVAALTPPADDEAAREPLAMQASSAHLKHFAPNELILTAAEACRVIMWFWPDVTATSLGAVSDTDRSFAQALLLEAIDASADMKIVEDVYKATYMKVFTDFEDVWEVVKTLAKKAYEDEWFTRAKGKITREKVEHLTIYDSVKKTLARNFRSEMKIRVATGEYVGY